MATGLDSAAVINGFICLSKGLTAIVAASCCCKSAGFNKAAESVLFADEFVLEVTLLVFIEELAVTTRFGFCAVDGNEEF